MRRPALIALAVLGCAPAAPDTPTYLADVRPILAANCIRCHGSPARGGAPTTFRLDTYLDDGEIKGALSMSEFIAARTADLEDMPPRGASLSGRQKEILDAWRSEPELGARPGNRPPAVTAVATAGADELVTLDLDVSDPDGDLVHGTVTSGEALIGKLRAGRQTLVWDTSVLAAGSHPLTATIDDGSGPVAVPLEPVTVAHANAAPSFSFVEPRRDALIRPGFAAEIVFRAADVNDGDIARLTFAFEAVRGVDQVIAIPAGTIGVNPDGTRRMAFDPSILPEGTTWRLRATVSDTQVTRTHVSEQFIVSKGTTSETAETIAPILAVCQHCHDTLLPTGPDFENLELVRLYAGRSWRKVWQLREMPPRSMEVIAPELTFSESDRQRLAEWLFAGAP